MTLRLLAVLLAAATAAPALAADAAVPFTLYTARTSGTITVGPDGRVVDVDLEGERALGRSVVEGYEAKIREWTFEPVLEDGKPVTARGFLSLALLAAREDESDEAVFGIRNVWFLEPPASGRGKPRGESASLQPPRYPAQALRAGAGAEVTLMLELAPDGQVLRVATEELSVLGMTPGMAPKGSVEAMVEAAESAAAGWRIPAHGGGTVRVPVRFSTSAAGWQRLSPVAWTPAPWVTEARAMSAAVQDLSASGETSRLTLLTELPKLPGAGG